MMPRSGCAFFGPTRLVGVRSPLALRAAGFSAGSGSAVLRATAFLAMRITTSVTTSRWNRSSST